MPTAISSQRLSKYYRIGERREIPDTLVGAAKSVVLSPYRRFRTLQSPQGRARTGTDAASDNFWALKEVSFEVEEGDVVGILGRNGAGKSTLLKILSRITKPSQGRAIISGRVSSLLEVGTGFHPELTGRDNIYMNGTILGMRKTEIDRKFEEIVDFAGVSKFLDTPTKRYSSGMRVRLAFAVAANLEPEILIVDEVLAVGDLEFQKKCLGKMKNVASSGRTVLFVSHNAAAVESLCTQGMVLENGSILMTGPIKNALERYRELIYTNTRPSTNPTKFLKTKYLKGVETRNEKKILADYVETTKPLSVAMEINTEGTTLKDPRIRLGFDDLLGNPLMTLDTPIEKGALETAIHGKMLISCHIAEFPLAPGRYTISIELSESRETIDLIPAACTIDVEDCNLFGQGRGFWKGVLTTRAQWSQESL